MRIARAGLLTLLLITIFVAALPAGVRTYQQWRTAEARATVERFRTAALQSDSVALTQTVTSDSLVVRMLSLYRQDSVLVRQLLTSAAFRQGHRLDDSQVLLSYGHSAPVCDQRQAEESDLQFRVRREGETWRIAYFGGMC